MFKLLVVSMAFLTVACASQSKNLSDESRTPAQAEAKTDPYQKLVTINQPYGQIVHITNGYDSSLEIFFSNGKSAIVTKNDAITQQLIIAGFTAKKNIDYQIEDSLAKVPHVKKVFISFYPNNAY